MFRLLIAYTVDQSIEYWKGYFYAVLFFVTAIVGACLQQRLYIISYSIGLRVKASIISAVYKKVLGRIILQINIAVV